ncbi:Nif11-like leader peptide family natural product precursor [Nostoc sp. KVJ3]|uniref:Nif11-like leader peptide family natural product precursor n=1 Tax=Nostoc sp. KVJ3 TaxID=457945 RepID=UPI0022377015|nr:Nif11-like leader peptide family natural product precursor [Nostoc sp. KVJ3]MCW5317199.1 Nif11-like leader peptide family natural product precursor [Nostoc sp. KVJ3]
MSQQALEFFTKVNTDAALQQEVNTALEGKEDMEAANAFVWVGAKHGYEFTAEEAAAKYQEIIAAADEELEEEALEKVAGGKPGQGLGVQTYAQ